MTRDMTSRIEPECGICNSQNFRSLFQKKSEKGEAFWIARCGSCGTVQTIPRPSAEELTACYQGAYFERRTDRGYADYTSEAVRNQVERVFAMNLTDMGFFEWEDRLRQVTPTPRALDVGCAAGYFVRYMEGRGWASEGIEISASMTDYARNGLGLNVRQGDFLADGPGGAYDLVTLWASLEHFPDPRRLAIRLREALVPDGRLILSTCRWGLLSRMLGPRWRYMNVPEHLYFFSLRGIRRFFQGYGFELEAFTTYGSGLTARPGAGRLYALAKSLADPFVKRFGQGDMMALRFRRIA